MRTVGGIDYTVQRESTAHWWEEPNDYGPIKSMSCSYCGFVILKRYVHQPRTSKSGMGRYNRMRGLMVKHLHECHKEEMLERMNAESRKSRPRLNY